MLAPVLRRHEHAERELVAHARKLENRVALLETESAKFRHKMRRALARRAARGSSAGHAPRFSHAASGSTASVGMGTGASGTVIGGSGGAGTSGGHGSSASATSSLDVQGLLSDDDEPASPAVRPRAAPPPPRPPHHRQRSMSETANMLARRIHRTSFPGT